MTVAAEATEAKSILLLAELRRCINAGVSPSAYWVKNMIAELENSSITDTTARVDLVVSNFTDGRNAAEAAVIA